MKFTLKFRVFKYQFGASKVMLGSFSFGSVAPPVLKVGVGFTYEYALYESRSRTDPFQKSSRQTVWRSTVWEQLIVKGRVKGWVFFLFFVRGNGLLGPSV